MNKEYTNCPQEIINAWTALEVLSPSTYSEPYELAQRRDPKRIELIDDDTIPWKSKFNQYPLGYDRKEYDLFYHVVLGSIPMQQAMKTLLAHYHEIPIEREEAKGEAIIASFILDETGCPLEEENLVVVSSFAWGLPKALSGALKELASWPAEESSLRTSLFNKVNDLMNEQDADCMTYKILLKAYQWLLEKCSLDIHLTTSPFFVVKYCQKKKIQDPPSSLILNSFYLKDLALVKSNLARGSLPDNLERFLGIKKPKNRVNMLQDKKEIEQILSPKYFPLGRWPGKGRHPLVLLQQAAVNLAFQQLHEQGLLAINGPPGTGKTTLLRDIIAGLLTERAKAMCAFEEPAKAFKFGNVGSGQSIAGVSGLHPSLKGFEVIVASSNNKAVENVTTELPNIDAIAEDLKHLRYFNNISDNLLDRHNTDHKTWGMISSVLGRRANIKGFSDGFWWDTDYSLSSYLANICGTPRLIPVYCPKKKEIIGYRDPHITKLEKPPNNFEEALLQWRDAKDHFLKTHTKAKSVLIELEKVRQAIEQLPMLIAEKESAHQLLLKSKKENSYWFRRYATLKQEQKQKAERHKKIIQKRLHHQSLKPIWWRRIFKTPKVRRWENREAILMRNLKACHCDRSSADMLRRETVNRLKPLRIHTKALTHSYKQACAAHAEAVDTIKKAREKYPGKIIDKSIDITCQQSHILSPWCDAEIHVLRDEVLIAAMAVHRAFIGAAAKPLRGNMSAFFNYMAGKSSHTTLPASTLADLWSSFFLIVPCVSTTFASIQRMLGRLEPGSLGWLLIDEAGQAQPQHAVGAMMRLRRTVVVGDPMQIEPVVILPHHLTEQICNKFSIDPKRFNAPKASCQTLADAASQYFAKFPQIGKQKSRSVGIPLLVHRRCSDPMFKIANRVAYADLMLYAKKTGISVIRECLGDSSWFDVRGDAKDKWCPQEGEKVIALLTRLYEANINPDIFIITPFRIVADNLRQILQKTQMVKNWTDNPWRWCKDRIGTIHTVQGREAEGVIFVLGAPDPCQSGARRWAGSTPNLLNVALTRAKECFYVVGHRLLWSNQGVFRQLDSGLKDVSENTTTDHESALIS